MTGDSTPTAAVEAVARAIAKRNYASATAVDIDEMWIDFIGDAEVAIAAMPPAIGEQWRSIAEAKKDGSIIWACLHPRIYPDLLPGREDLERWNGVQVPLRHPGVCADGFDIGWNVAAPVGNGGFPDDWIVGWSPLPAPPESVEP